MKKLTLSNLALFALTLTGCVKESQMGKVNADQRMLNSVDDKIVTAEYNGHSYIIYKGYNKGGITHDPTARAKRKEEKNENNSLNTTIRRAYQARSKC